MKSYYKAFTLVELIVSISLSIVLMVAVGMFLTDWVKNITLQKKILENNSLISDFSQIISNEFDSISLYETWFLWSQTWVLFKMDKSYDKWWFMYLWEKSFSWFYCSWSTNHIIIKNFIPFEKDAWDIFSWYNYDDWTYKTSFFSWTILKWASIFTWTYFWASDLVFWAWNDMYVSDTLNHVILKFDKTNTNIMPQIVLWKSSIFWYKQVNSDTWTLVSLNNPTGLAYDSVDNILFVADTLNDRILYLSGWLAYTLLDRYDSLREPTWLYYEAWNLYISNSGAWEILVYSGGTDSNLFSKADNVLKVLKSWFWYPTWISLAWWNLKISDFLWRKIYLLNKNTWFSIPSTNLSSFDFSRLAYNKNSDYLLDTPISFSLFDFSNNLFTFMFKYYKNYSCNNSNENIEKTYLFKKFIK